MEPQIILIESQDGNDKTWLFEADIALTDEPEGRDIATSGIESPIMKRSLRRSQEYLWIDRVVPYEINPELGKKFTISMGLFPMKSTLNLVRTIGLFPMKSTLNLVRNSPSRWGCSL